MVSIIWVSSSESHSDAVGSHPEHPDVILNEVKDLPTASC